MIRNSKILKILLVIAIGLFATACIAPTPTPQASVEFRDDYKSEAYDSFEDGLNNFSHNALIGAHNSLVALANSDYIPDLKGSQKDYYDGICLVFDMLKLEMTVIAEISALKPNDAVAKALHLLNGVRYEEDGGAV